MSGFNKRQYRRGHTRGAFTLVELMVVVVIVGVGALGLAGLSVVAGTHWRGASHHHTPSLVLPARFDPLTGIQCHSQAPTAPKSGIATSFFVTDKWWVKDTIDVTSIIGTAMFEGRQRALACTSVIPERD